MNGPDARDRAVREVRELIRGAAIAVFGATPTDDPLEATSPLRRRLLDDPLAGVRAARLTADVAAGQLREWALRARGAGRSWDDVATALDLPEADGETAWEWLIERRPPAPGPAPRGARPASAIWTCTTCRARVRDTGPFESHPDDREAGHAASCTRHASAIAVWRRDAGLDDNDVPEEGR